MPSLFLIFSLFSNRFSYIELTWLGGFMVGRKTFMWWEINSILSTITIYQWREHIKHMRNNSKVLLRKRHNEKRPLCEDEIGNRVPMDAIPIIPLSLFPSKLSGWCLNGNEKHFVCSVMKDITVSSKHGLQDIKFMSTVPLMIISVVPWRGKPSGCILNRFALCSARSGLLVSLSGCFSFVMTQASAPTLAVIHKCTSFYSQVMQTIVVWKWW